MKIKTAERDVWDRKPSFGFISTRFGEQVHAGLYITRITTGNEMKTAKLMYLK